MLDRFTGTTGKPTLTKALSRQTIVQGSSDLASALADTCELLAVESGRLLIAQHAPNNDIYFILAGEFSILVNGRPVASVRAEEHVGEMALVDPKGRQSAAVIALEDSVVARISEPEFATIADSHPHLWKNVACSLGERLRQRNEFVLARNGVPKLFVGSSKESLDVANAIRRGLPRDAVDVTVWTHGVFGPSEFPIESLERIAIHSDFAALVLGPDDRVVSRAQKTLAPRDNVVLELGLFIGAVGRRRVFLVRPRDLDVKIPTDLLGIRPVEFKPKRDKSGAVIVTAACKALRRAIDDQGPR